MEAAPVARHASELETIPIETEADIVTARRSVRDFGREAGFSSVDLALIATAVSEVCRNILEYARRGTLSYGWDRKHGQEGLLIVAEDQGPGIANIELAMRDGYSTGNSLGMGLPGVKRLMDEFHLESTPGKGTRVVIHKWKS